MKSNLREIKNRRKAEGVEPEPKKPRRKLSEEEQQARALAKGIGERLSLTLMQELDDRTDETREYTRLIRAELKSAKPNMKRVTQLNRLRMTNRDVGMFNDSVQDRFGHHRKSQLDLNGKTFAPLQVVFIEKTE